MSTHSWFISKDSKVSGPLSTEEVNTLVDAGKLAPGTFIWWKGQREWVPISFWREKFHEVLASITPPAQKPTWYVDIGTTQIGPLSQTELIAHLKMVKDLENVTVWMIGREASKKKVFEMHDVVEMLGIDRREYERVPLRAEVLVSTWRHDEDLYMTSAGISLGGIGLNGTHDLRRGDEVTLEIKSLEMSGVLRVSGMVVNAADNGFIGIRFQNPSAEAQAIVRDYVRQFDANGARDAA